jgi:hypothetical protein
MVTKFDLPREMILMDTPLELVPAVEVITTFGHTLMTLGNPCFPVLPKVYHSFAYPGPDPAALAAGRTLGSRIVEEDRWGYFARLYKDTAGAETVESVVVAAAAAVEAVKVVNTVAVKVVNTEAVKVVNTEVVKAVNKGTVKAVNTRAEE